MPSSLLPSLAHALSGSTGTAISTLSTYPLDLVNTRLKVQRQLSPSSSPEKHYSGIIDAFRKIYASEGGVSAFFAGLKADVAKSVVDSFLFFLFYNWFRGRRLAAGGRRRRELNAAEELAIGAVAGACARFFTTPVGNVVTRRQTACLIDGEEGDKGKGVWEILSEIRRERGVAGLWAGYSASLVLTLNPSITFFLQQSLTNRLGAGEEGEGGEGAGLMFGVAAVSKAVATGLTYPFQIAKARVQVSKPEDDEKELVTVQGEKVGTVGKETIFGTVGRIRREEGVGALYDGLRGELIKAFFSHGVTMVSKDVVHKLLFRLYFAIMAWFRRHPGVRERFERRVVGLVDGVSLGRIRERGGEMWRERKELAAKVVSEGESIVKSAASSGESVVKGAMSSGESVVKGVMSSGENVVKAAVSSGESAARTAMSSGEGVVTSLLEEGKKIMGK